MRFADTLTDVAVSYPATWVRHSPRDQAVRILAASPDGSLAPRHVRLPESSAVRELAGFGEGGWWVQDAAAARSEWTVVHTRRPAGVGRREALLPALALPVVAESQPGGAVRLDFDHGAGEPDADVPRAVVQPE